MSSHYTHFLIPALPDYRPNVDAVATFMDGVIRNGHVAEGPTITFSDITKVDQRNRQIVNPMTGQTITMQLPSRRIGNREQVSSLSELARVSKRSSEYDVSVAAFGYPPNPSCIIGCVEDQEWKAFDQPYHHEVICHVRSRIVRLSILKDEGDLTRPLDFENYQPYFGEDCTADERDGVFVHPGIGAIRIPFTGCGTFWIEFAFGKSVFPFLKGDDVCVLDQSIVQLARTTFGVNFVEACNWG